MRIRLRNCNRNLFISFTIRLKTIHEEAIVHIVEINNVSRSTHGDSYLADSQIKNTFRIQNSDVIGFEEFYSRMFVSVLTGKRNTTTAFIMMNLKINEKGSARTQIFVLFSLQIASHQITFPRQAKIDKANVAIFSVILLASTFFVSLEKSKLLITFKATAQS